MLELTLDKNYFNHQFLKFRVRYYFNETKELLARHKLLAAFVICLLAPGVKNIQDIGIPFYALIDPYSTFKAKLFYLVLILFCLLTMTKAQLPFIKGGAFREYLHTLDVPLFIHKAVDFIILLLSLNLVWLAIFFGGLNILHYSQYCLYGSIIFALCTLLFNVLYKNTANKIVLVSALLLIVFISKQENSLLNFAVGMGVSLLCGVIIWRVKPFPRRRVPLFKIPQGYRCFDLLKTSFIIQAAVLRENKTSCLIRVTVCFAVTTLLLQVLTSAEIQTNRQGIVLVLISLQTYILSTLFTLFEKEKQEHALFHKIFPYQRLIQPIKEIIFIWIGLVLLLLPVFAFCLFSNINYIPSLFTILAMNCVISAINRTLYAISLRFCLFSSLLNTIGGWVIQYIILGVCFG